MDDQIFGLVKKFWTDQVQIPVIEPKLLEAGPIFWSKNGATSEKVSKFLTLDQQIKMPY